MVWGPEVAETAIARFSTQGWPQSLLVDGGEIIVPAGRYGVYAFDLDAFNLLDPL